jgi:tubulin--tyrosine ligase
MDSGPPRPAPEGIVRTSSESYTRDDPANLFAHITNHCIQETGPNFSKFEDGNVLRYGQLQAFLDQAHPGHDFREEIIPQMKDIIHTCFQATKSYLVHSCCNHTFAMCCFQIFGFDFLVDDGFRVWLLEVNGQPWVAEALRPEFIKDVIELVINPLFRPPGWTPGPHGFEKVDLGASRFPPRPSSIIRRTSSPDD